MLNIPIYILITARIAQIDGVCYVSSLRAVVIIIAVDDVPATAPHWCPSSLGPLYHHYNLNTQCLSDWSFFLM